MLQFKRFFVLIYLHLILSVILTYLNTVAVFSAPYFNEDWMKALFGLFCVSLVYALIGLLWGIITPQKKKLLLPLSLYALVIVAVYSVGVMLPRYWIVFINADIPYTYLIRNIATRTLAVNAIHALACVVPSLALYEAFKLSFGLSHRNSKTTVVDQTGSFPV